MTQQEYFSKLATAKAIFEDTKKKLGIEYSKSQEIFKVGDIIESGFRGIVKVTKISVYYNHKGIPEPLYIGDVLKKDFTPRKDGATEAVYTSDDARKIGYDAKMSI